MSGKKTRHMLQFHSEGMIVTYNKETKLGWVLREGTMSTQQMWDKVANGRGIIMNPKLWPIERRILR